MFLIFRLIVLWLLTASWLGAKSVLPYLIPPEVTSPEIGDEGEAGAPLKHPLVVFWNMRWYPAQPGEDPSSPEVEKKIKGSAAVLQQTAADIILLCEVLDLRSLKRMSLAYPYQACTTIKRHPQDHPTLPSQNLALLSRAKPERIWVLDFHQLPGTPDRPSRGILGAQFKIDTESTLTCYALHLKSNLGGYRQTALRRERAIDYLQWDMARLDLDPARDLILVAGDMNTSMNNPLFRQEATLRTLTRLGFKPAPLAPATTSRGDASGHGHKRLNEFDHIYLSTSLRQRMEEEGQIVQGTTFQLSPDNLSDHDPIGIRLRIQQGLRSAP
jgi:endonuclease/exonuclease/phosphatase family metal-dependent hydrolase